MTGLLEHWPAAGRQEMSTFSEKLDKRGPIGHRKRLMGQTDDFSDEVSRCADRLAESGVAALGGLYDLTSQRLVRYATTLSRNQHDAEDAVQSALAKVAADPKFLCRADRPWSYLLRMVRNEVLMAKRKRRRLAFFAELADLLTRCPVDELEREDTYRRVWAALRGLPALQAEVVVLKIWEEMTFAQIAEVQEVSLDTAASRYRYGLKRLGRTLSPRHLEALYD